MFGLKTQTLVVDDMVTIRKLITKICKDIRFTDVIDAAEGIAAWQLVSNSVPMVAFVDMLFSILKSSCRQARVR